MTTEQRVILAAELERDEGRILHAYQDHLGYWTIGIGRLIDKRKGGRISDEEADYLLDNDISAYEHELLDTLPWVATLDPVRQRVLVNVAFNMGVPNLLDFHNTLAAAKRGDVAAVRRGMLASKWHRQVGARAERLADAYVRGEIT